MVVKPFASLLKPLSSLEIHELYVSMYDTEMLVLNIAPRPFDSLLFSSVGNSAADMCQGRLF